MKILRFASEAGPRIGVLEGDGIVPLNGSGFDSVIDLVAAGATGLDSVAAHVACTKVKLPLEGARLLAPIERPGKFLGIGMNYGAHADEARELGLEVPDKQLWFNKQTSSLSGPFDLIDPGVTEQLDYEVELGVIIGAPAKAVAAEAALAHIFGYVVVNDVSARDWQFHSQTFTMGKSFDTHGPIGPWIVTADEIGDPQTLGLRCLVNGEVRQSSNTRKMIHSIAQQIAYLSTAFTLEPGDILATGTPEGVGIGFNPPRFLQSGDVVRCEVDSIGAIENVVAARNI